MRSLFEAFVEPDRLLADRAPLSDVLVALARAVAVACRADVAVIRLPSPHGTLVARGVYASSPVLAAQIEGSEIPASALPAIPVSLGDSTTVELERLLRRVQSEQGVIFPLRAGDELRATLELYRGKPFEQDEWAAGEAAMAKLAVALRLPGTGDPRGRQGDSQLDSFVEALAAGGDELETAELVVRLTAERSQARSAALWRVERDAEPVLLTGWQLDEGVSGPVRDSAAAAVSVRERRSCVEALPDGATAVTLPLGEPPGYALQLGFVREAERSRIEAAASIGARAAPALRRARRAWVAEAALSRSELLTSVIGEAISRLSLQHTLETTIEWVAELTGSPLVAVYLSEGSRLEIAASRGVGESAGGLGELLLELLLGRYRARGFALVEDASAADCHPELARAAREAGVQRALAVPLAAADELIGVLAVFGLAAHPYREGEETLLIALARQLAVAVQNARLHERAKELGEVLEQALESERRAARQLRALYSISSSFAESLSLEATLDAVAVGVVELFGLDAAAIRLPNGREELETRALHVADSTIRSAVEAILALPERLTSPTARRLLQRGRPIILGPRVAQRSEAHRTLAPFLAKGASAAILPLSTPAKTLGTLTLLSLDPARQLDDEVIKPALAVAKQAALAIDNARLYQQQRDFAEVMQRSLLPQELPDVAGVEIGHVYQSAAQVDVGGDVYDFLPLDDGRLAVVVGDVIGKGVDAASDMARAKFTFRALARRDPDPAEFLHRANEVVTAQLELGKFITMLYALVDPLRRTLVYASAGHPAPRFVERAGVVPEVSVSGLALGVAPEQRYVAREVELAPGSSAVIYTDGVIEARRGHELYGTERLDQLLALRSELSAQSLAEAILLDCRSFAGGNLADDCAVVVIRLAE